jgi:hypothetical protein
VPQPGCYPLVVAPLFKSKRIHKVLMDGENDINMLYVSTLDDMGIPRSQLRPSTTPFHGVDMATAGSRARLRRKRRQQCGREGRKKRGRWQWKRQER